ncbi:MAG: FtsW/RodA/SpoVE family cell cycle protein [Oscillospiraceae bacterium]
MKAILNAIWQYFKKLDKQLFFVVFAVSCFSVLLLFSFVKNGMLPYEMSNPSAFYMSQVKAVILGASCALVISGIDYIKIGKLWFLYGPLTLILTLLLFTSLGIKRDGADDIAWLNLGFMSIQPSEFLKIAFIMTFSYHISAVHEHINKPLNVFLLCIHGIVPTAIIAISGDYGTAAVFIAIFLCMLFSAGISWKYIFAALLITPAVGVFAWFKILQPVHRKRILVLFDPSLDTSIGDQQRLGKIALGSGQLFGKGIFGGDYSYVPEAHNDFIFSYIGQTCGFVGCLLLVGALAYICLKILANSRTAKDIEGKCICVGAFALIFSHSLINIGMVLGVMPVIGVPLPFTSSGGTAMLSMYIAIGLVMSTYSHSARKTSLFYDSK